MPGQDVRSAWTRTAARVLYRVHKGVLVPEQVRNLRPATKVALDFVAPESAGVAQRLREVAALRHPSCVGSPAGS